jgi:hypothetical protein
MNYGALWTARWTRKLLGFLFRIRLRAASQGCRNLLRTSAREGATGTEPRIRTVRQLAATAGDGLLGFAGSPGQLETSLNSGYTVGPCNSYLEGPTLFIWACCSRNRALDPPPSSALAEEERLCSLLLRAAARDLPTLAAHVAALSRGRRAICRPSQPAQPLPLRPLASLDPHHLWKPGLTQVSAGLHGLQPAQSARNLRIHRFLTSGEGLATTPC